jgi:hypothetical protein
MKSDGASEVVPGNVVIGNGDRYAPSLPVTVDVILGRAKRRNLIRE